MFDSSGRRSFLIAGKQLHEIPVQVSDERDPQSGLGCVAGRPNRAAARLHTRMPKCSEMSLGGRGRQDVSGTVVDGLRLFRRITDGGRADESGDGQ